MEARIDTTRSKPQTAGGAYDKLLTLTLWGGVAFWTANFATTLLPVAAEYRAALSISYLPMVLVESLVGGLIIGSGVSYFLLRFYHQLPTKSPILKAGILSFVALLLALFLTGLATSRLETGAALRYFVIGAMLNVPRFLVLGIVVGYLYKRLYGSAAPTARAHVPS